MKQNITYSISFVVGVGCLILGVVAVLSGWGGCTREGDHKQCEAEKYSKCVPSCLKRQEDKCREAAKNGIADNPVVDYALCVRNACDNMCGLMSWANCHLPEKDHLGWKE